jgi:hypothetical protein
LTIVVAADEINWNAFFAVFVHDNSAGDILAAIASAITFVLMFSYIAIDIIKMNKANWKCHHSKEHSSSSAFARGGPLCHAQQ